MKRGSVRIPPEMCAHCGYLIDTQTGISGKRVPVEGDMSMCLNCGHIRIMHDTRWVDLTATELAAMSVEEKAYILAIRAARRVAVSEDLSRGRGGVARGGRA